MARPREFDPQKVLQVAIDLFWEKGYAEASVDEVVKRSGVAKYGVYGNFGNKYELFKSALLQYSKDRHRDIQAPLRKPKAALPEIRQFFKKAALMMTQREARRGCLMVNSGLELGLKEPEIKKMVFEFFSETEEVMRQCLERAVALKQLDSSLDIPSLATYLINEFRTTLMLAGSGHSRRHIQSHLSIALRVLE